MTTYFVKKGNWGKILTAQLLHSDTKPIDLTGATVTFRRNRAGSVMSEGSASIIGAPSQGFVSYALSSGDVSQVGDFSAEWHVVFNDGTVLDVPTPGFDILKVVPITSSL